MKYVLKVQGIHMKSAMKYPKERFIESTRYPHEMCNEIS